MTFHEKLGILDIPTDELTHEPSFFRGVGQPPSRLATAPWLENPTGGFSEPRSWLAVNSWHTSNPVVWRFSWDIYQKKQGICPLPCLIFDDFGVNQILLRKAVLKSADHFRGPFGDLLLVGSGHLHRCLHWQHGKTCGHAEDDIDLSCLKDATKKNVFKPVHMPGTCQLSGIFDAICLIALLVFVDVAMFEQDTQCSWCFAGSTVCLLFRC